MATGEAQMEQKAGWWDRLWHCRCSAGPWPDFDGFAEHAAGVYRDPGRFSESHYPVGIPERVFGPLPDALAEELRSLVAHAKWHTSKPGYSYTLHWYVLSHEPNHNCLYRLMYRAVWEHGEFSAFAWNPVRTLTLDEWRYWPYSFAPDQEGVLNRVNIVQGTLTRRGMAPVDELTGRPLKAPEGWADWPPRRRQDYIQAQRSPEVTQRAEQLLRERLQANFGLPEVVATDIARRLAWGRWREHRRFKVPDVAR